MDLNFEQMLAEHNQEFKEAAVYSNWMPPDGEYIVSVIKSDKGVSSKSGTDLAWWKLLGRIEDVGDEKLDGREFPIGYFTSRAYGILKGAARILSGNSDLNDLGEANEVIEASPGSVLRVRVRTSISRKDGKEYTNCFILEVIDTTTEASTVEPAGEAILPDGDTTSPNAVPAEVPAGTSPVV